MLGNKKLKAVGSTVVVEIKGEEEMSSAGIITGLNVHAASTVVGKVVDMGPFAYINAEGEFNPRCRLGDSVVFKQNCGVVWQDKDTKQYYRVMYDDDVIAQLVEKNNG